MFYFFQYAFFLKKFRGALQRNHYEDLPEQHERRKDGSEGVSITLENFLSSRILALR